MIVILMAWETASAQDSWMQEKGFVYLDEVLDHALYEVRYYGSNNFIGRPIDGYQTNRPVMTHQAATALREAEQLLYKQGWCLKIFDTYRPQRAVNDFITWSRLEVDTLMKSVYYPYIAKEHLFRLGYIATRSGHSRGSTIDLTLASIYTGKEADMGGAYDYFGEVSHHSYDQLTRSQRTLRQLLKKIMNQVGFRSYVKEWWHYTLNQEPYPDTYFDFVVEP